MKKGSNSLLEAALEYHKRGWSIMPIKIAKKVNIKKSEVEYTKQPLVKWEEYQEKQATKEQIIGWWNVKYSKAGIGLITGRASGLIVVDVDSRKGEENLKQKGVPLTPCVKTFRGRHIYFKHPGFEVKNFTKKHGLDLRGDGGFAVLPPTKDPRGGAYEWQISLDEAELAPAPEWLLSLIKEKKPGKKLKETELTSLLKGVKKGKRHDTATRLAGYWLGKRIETSVALIQLKDWNKKNRPPLPEEELERIVRDFAQKKPEPEFEPQKPQFNPRPYSEKILSQYKLIFDKYRRFWFYDKKEGIWKENFPLFLNEKLRKEILELQDLKQNRVNEILKDLEGLCYVENRPDEPPAYLIPFKNKIYDLKAEKTLEYDPEYFFINKLGINYNPEGGEYPQIQKFFENIVPEDDIITLEEIIAYCFYRGYPYPKSFWLYGIGANGKSRYAQVIRKIIGQENISAVSLSKLQVSQFGSWELYGKLANISPELSRSVIRNADVLKQLTGEDLISMERKFRDPFPYVNYSKLIFLANEIPWSEDKSFAFYRRIFLIEFPNLFEIALKADTRIIERIPEIEFEALGYNCLQLLKDLYSEERGFAFTRHKRTMEVQAEYEKVSDPLGMFLEKKTKSDPEGYIPVIDFNTEFKKWEKDKSLRIWTDRQIASVMAQKGYTRRTKNIKLTDKDYHTFKAYLELNWKEKNED